MSNSPWGNVQIEIEEVLDEDSNVYLKRAENELRQGNYGGVCEEICSARNFSKGNQRGEVERQCKIIEDTLKEWRLQVCVDMEKEVRKAEDVCFENPRDALYHICLARVIGCQGFTSNIRKVSLEDMILALYGYYLKELKNYDGIVLDHTPYGVEKVEDIRSADFTLSDIIRKYKEDFVFLNRMASIGDSCRTAIQKISDNVRQLDDRGEFQKISSNTQDSGDYYRKINDTWKRLDDKGKILFGKLRGGMNKADNYKELFHKCDAFWGDMCDLESREEKGGRAKYIYEIRTDAVCMRLDEIRTDI